MFGGSQHRARQGSHQRQFEKNREKERADIATMQSLATTTKALAYATWENKTNDTIARRRNRERIAQLGREQEEKLQGRRRRLKELLEAEAAGWEQELLSRAETMEQRKERIRERATALRAAREEARAEMVRQSLDRQWRDACDDARTLDSAALLRYVASQRGQQVAEKEMRLKAEADADAAYLEEIQRRMAELREREDKAEATRREMDHTTKHDLDAQVRYNAGRRLQHLQRQREEDAAELQELAGLLANEAAKERERREAAHAAGRDVLAFNVSRRALAAEAAAAEKERDVQLLKYAEAKDAAGEAEEKRKREHEKNVMRQYRDYLREQMAKEAKNQSAYDAVRLQAENRIWDQREAEQKARADARNALAAEVHEGRQLQMKLKAARQNQQKRAEDEQARLAKENLQEAEAAERLKEERRQQAVLENLAKLRLQIADKEQRREAERRAQEAEEQELARAAEAHKERLERQAGVVVLHRPRNHTQWYS